MKKLLLLIIAFTFTFNYSQAQRKCGTMDYWEAQKAQDPTLESKRIALEKWTQDMINAGKYSVDTAANTINIPTVIHIVYKTNAQNVSDARVIEQLNMLNRDYAGLNTHSMYSFPSSLKANTTLQYCLAQRTPDGLPTNGIERRVTTVSSFSTNNNVKKYTTGGMDPWDVHNYMNIWVCNLSGGILGYGQFPSSGINSTYGLVVHFEAFGSTGALPPYNMGGTSAHEIGHCLNLYHTWGDDGNACTGTDYCTDTPNQAGENYTPPSFPHITCGNGPLGDMFMNFMDYTDDIALANFTPDQTDRMLALFAPGGVLNSITTSKGCLPPACDIPMGMNSTPYGFTNAILTWLPIGIQSGIELQYHLVGDSVWTDTILSGAALSTFTLNNLQPGSLYEWQIRCLCDTTSSAFSAVNTFLTSECVDTFEPNNLISAAKVIGANETNDTILAMLETRSDIDWYRFSMTNFKNVQIRMESLPGNYDLRIFRSNGICVIKSTLAGSANESVVLHNLVPGNYYIRISGADSSNVDCYTLSIERTTAPQAVASRDYNIEDDGVGHARLAKFTPGIYPNPARNEVNIAIESETETSAIVSLFDLTGRACINKTFDLKEGSNSLQLNLSGIIPGLYFVKIVKDGDISYTRLVVE